MLPNRPVHRSVTSLFAGFLLLAFVLGCRGQESGWLTAPQIAPSAQNLPIDTIETLGGKIWEPTRRIIDERSVWERLWKRAYESRWPTPELPEVDFDHSVVLVAAMGQKPTGGYDITIERVARRSDTLYARIREVFPSKDCGVTTSFTYPWQAVRVPVSDVEVLVTVEQDLTGKCGS